MKKHRQEYIAEDFNANTIAVTGPPCVCGGPVMTRSPIEMLISHLIIHLLNLNNTHLTATLSPPGILEIGPELLLTPPLIRRSARE